VPDQTALFPDLKRVAIQVLLNAAVAGGRVYSSLPSDAGSAARPYPLLVVHRYGGTPLNQRWIDRASLQIEAWGNDQETCFTLWNVARKALLDAVGTTVLSTVISNAYVTVGPQDLPDPPTGKDRSIGDIALFGHPVS
jgi:hypothetical protein